MALQDRPQSLSTIRTLLEPFTLSRKFRGDPSNIESRRLHSCPAIKSAESLAKKLKKPRSHLYAEALASYVSSPDPKAITENLNEVYSRHSSAVDPAIEKAQTEILPDERW